MATFNHKLAKKDTHKHTEPYLCAACGRYAVDKAVSYEELKTKPGVFNETDRTYWCGSHRKPGTITHQDGTVDPSDFEPISDMDDYT